MNKLSKFWRCAEVHSTVSAKLLYHVLLEICDGNGAVTIPQKKLAYTLGLSKDTVSRNLRRLRDAGLISIQPQYRTDDGGRAANKYQIKLRGV